MKRVEEFVYAAVISGELEIDDHGRVWRVGIRTTDRWSGRVWIRACKRRRAERVTPLGYLQVAVMINLERRYTGAHRLVYRHVFGAIPDGLTINHINGIKDDNRPSNLELATYSEQIRHANDVLGCRRQDGEKNHRAKLSEDDVFEIRTRRANGERLVSIAEDFGVAYQTISKVARGYRWSHLEGFNV